MMCRQHPKSSYHLYQTVDSLSGRSSYAPLSNTCSPFQNFSTTSVVGLSNYMTCHFNLLTISGMWVTFVLLRISTLRILSREAISHFHHFGVMYLNSDVEMYYDANSQWPRLSFVGNSHGLSTAHKKWLLPPILLLYRLSQWNKKQVLVFILLHWMKPNKV